MKTKLTKLAVTLLLSLIAISGLYAEPNPQLQPLESNNAPTAFVIPTPADVLAEKKLDLEREQTANRLGAEKEMADKRYNAERSMVHDLAWNSWVLFAISIFFFCYLRDRRRDETIRLMIEKGTPMTPELLDSLRKKSAPRPAWDQRGYLCWGVILTALAFGLMIAFTWGAGRSAAWIVLAIGVAYLILWLFERVFSRGGQSQ